MTPKEEWRPVVGWENLYQVSDHGRVRSLDRTITRVDGLKKRFKGRLLRPVPDDHGYPRVWLPQPGGDRRRHRVHVLVLKAFVGPRPDGLFGCHDDGNPSNNYLPNLYWGTESENVQDTIRHGRHHQLKKTHCKRNHEFTPENTRMTTTGGRQCLKCRRIVDAERRAAT